MQNFEVAAFVDLFEIENQKNDAAEQEYHEPPNQLQKQENRKHNSASCFSWNFIKKGDLQNGLKSELLAFLFHFFNVFPGDYIVVECFVFKDLNCPGDFCIGCKWVFDAAALIIISAHDFVG